MPASAMLLAMSRAPDAEPELEPPWAAYPWIRYGSIGWRMGCGEDYLIVRSTALRPAPCDC